MKGHTKIITIIAFTIATVGIICIIGLSKISNKISYISPYNSATSTIPNKIRILVVPGHEPFLGGTEYKNTKERELAVELGQNLKNILEESGKYEVYITRNNTAWTKTFENYFTSDWKNIISWEKTTKMEYLNLVALGIETKPISIIRHNSAPKDVATRLYGITKWANENKIDLMIHIHFNDDTDHKKNVVGKYSGFTMYVPSYEYANGPKSHLIAESLLQSLSLNSKVSNLPQESKGIVDEPKLIAIGVNNTSSVPSILIEYGYIYEPNIAKPSLQLQTLKTLSRDTYLGIDNFFRTKNISGVY